MQIKEIVNRDRVNLQNCESEPIHIPGSIQPHGILLAVNPHSFVIDYCSNNVADYLQMQPADILGKPLSEVLGDIEAQQVSTYISANIDATAHPHIITYKGVQYNTVIYRSGDVLIFELEPFPDGSLRLPDLYKQTRRFVNFMQDAGSLVQLSQNVADEIKSITGYDRVMIYRFDKEYNGEVIAEAVNEDLEPFLGLNYPHTDIPAQARQLYLTNLLRIIVDVNYTPVPIVTHRQNAGSADIDLSNSILRSVSPIHVQYLHNMGVGGTLTISLIHDKKLWGLVACHHYSPKNIPYYTRLASLLQGHFLTSQIKVREVAEEFALSQVIDDRLQQLLKLVAKSAIRVAEPEQMDAIMRLTNATGVALTVSGHTYIAGNVPAQANLQKLLQWLHKNADVGHYQTNNLSKDYLEGTAIADVAAGVLFQSLGNIDKDSIVWFRQEVEKSINWAGDPAKAIEKDEKGLSPRKSFALWKETVKLHSIEWRKPELNAAATFAGAMQKQLHVYYLTHQETKYRTLSEKLQLANNELANINWISTHDLKEPLRKIRIFASRILADEVSDSVRDNITRMQNAAVRMQALIDDILSYSKLSDMSQAFKPVDIGEVLKDVVKEAEDEINERKVQISVGELCTVNGIPFQLHQLFTNLIGNAIKYSKPGITTIIQVSCHEVKGDAHADLNPQQEYYKIAVQDNGIGFQPKYNEQIFQVFQKLNSSSQYTGTGIGLAICKKIAENHMGAIEAVGEEGSGALFNVYLPKETPFNK